MRNAMWMVGLVSLVACGGGGDVDLGVKSSKKLSDLDQADSCALYEGFADYSQQTQELSCYASAQAMSMVGGDFETACQAAFDSCMEMGSFLDEEVDCDTVENNLPAECDATVGELETCLSDVLGLLDLVADARCDRQLELSEFQELSAAMEGNETPESCEPLADESCGGFIF